MVEDDLFEREDDGPDPFLTGTNHAPAENK